MEDSACHFARQPAALRVLNIPELLGIVFTFCFPEDREQEPYSYTWSLNVASHLQYLYPSGTEVPLSLTHVSTLWRSVALATPKLWTRLGLHLDSREDGVRPQALLDALVLWLERSRSLPISVRISCDKDFDVYGFEDRERNALSGMVDAIIRNIGRLENLSFLMRYFVDRLYDALCCDLPHLETICIEKGYRATIRQGRIVSLGAAPKLQSVAMPGVVLTQAPQTLRSIGYSNIIMRPSDQTRAELFKEVVLNNVQLSNGAIYRFGTLFPLLENLVLSYVYPSSRFGKSEPWEDAFDHTDPGYCDLNNLFMLRIRGRGCCFPLNLVTAPNLTELIVVDDEGSVDNERDEFDDERDDLGDRRDDFGRTILNFLERSECPLEVFIYSTGLDVGPIRHLRILLEAMPDLQELVLENPLLCRSDLRILLDPTVCPQLTDIRSYGEIAAGRRSRFKDRSEEPTSQDILELIRARCRKRSPGISEQPEADSEMRVWVERLEFPLHETDEEDLRKDDTFLTADVEFINTHKCIAYCVLDDLYTHRGFTLPFNTSAYD